MTYFVHRVCGLPIVCKSYIATRVRWLRWYIEGSLIPWYKRTLCGYIPWMYWSINEVLSRTSITRSSATPNQTCECRLPIWSCNWIAPNDQIGCLFAYLGFRKSWGLTREAQVGSTRNLFMKFGPGPLPMRHLALCMLGKPTLTHVS